MKAGVMSAKTGDKSRHHRMRKQKLRRREKAAQAKKSK